MKTSGLIFKLSYLRGTSELPKPDGMEIILSKSVIHWLLRIICAWNLLCLLAQLFGHEKVSVLDGGLERWIADGYKTTNMMVKKMVRVINSFD